MKLSFLGETLQSGDILVVGSGHRRFSCRCALNLPARVRETGFCAAVVIIRGEDLLNVAHLHMDPIAPLSPQDSEGQCHLGGPWGEEYLWIHNGFWVFKGPGSRPRRDLGIIGLYSLEWEILTGERAHSALKLIQGNERQYPFFRQLEPLVQ